jgi:hypothetical protein
MPELDPDDPVPFTIPPAPELNPGDPICPVQPLARTTTNATRDFTLRQYAPP